MSKIPDRLRELAWDNASREQLGMLRSLDLGRDMAEIAKKHGFYEDQAKYRKYSAVIMGDLILQLLNPSDFPEALAEGLGISSTQATQIAEETLSAFSKAKPFYPSEED